MRRGPAADLAPYLAPDAHPALRKQAIRALGRIGDRAGATEWLVKLLGGGADLVDVLRAAGLSGAAELEGPVTGHLTSKDPQVQAEALLALGWIASESLGGYGAPKGTSDAAVRIAAKAATMLHSTSVDVRAAALDALALAGQEGYLERVLAFAHPMEEAEIQDAAAFAAWFLARARRTVAKGVVKDWGGEPAAASRVLPWLGDVSGRALDGIRVFGILAPPLLRNGRETLLLDKAVDDLARASDSRVTQELIARVLAPRPGTASDAWLLGEMAHLDPKVRQAAAEALGQHGSPEAIAALKAALEREDDERVRVALCVALAQAAKQADPRLKDLLGWLKGKQPEFVEEAEVRVASASKHPGTLDALADRAKTLSPRLQMLVLGALEEHRSEAVARYVRESLGAPDPYVRAAAIGIVGKQLLKDDLDVLDQLLVDADTHEERDVRQAVVEAWVEFAKAETTDAERRTTLRARILEVAHNDPAFTARAVARKACEDLGIEGCPAQDPLQPNDWRGLPRPKEPVLGLDLTKGGPWLDEAEILQLADRMAAERPEFVVQNDVDGEPALFRLGIDPSEAPVHAVSFLLAVTGKVYEGTLWHRVVPSFVIQGGDPHGDGSGDAGWSVPDEITRARFVRGALGMPKGNIRDTGGCQLFVMHSDYRPLDGRYTCYGRVVDGMDTVDRIRVGDRITSIRLVLSSASASVQPR